jgi:hypothetical protein
MGTTEPIEETGHSNATRSNGITLRSVILGLLTAAGSAYYGIAGSMVLHVGSLVKSNFPVSLILVFVIWVVINMIIARVYPRSGS